MESREAQTVRWSEVMLADIPEDLGDPTVEMASGVVRLPFRLDGNTPEGAHNLDDPDTRAYGYGKVIREGLAEDLRFYIDVDWLIKLWPRRIACHGPTPRRGSTGSGATAASSCSTVSPTRSEPPPVALNPLQERIALLAADLVTAEGFALVGAALNILAVVDRRTQDLDYFPPVHDTAVARYGDALEDVLRHEGLDVQVILRTDTFHRYTVSEGQWSTDIDLALDPQLYPAVTTPYGPILDLTDLGVNKLLAAFSRYEPRELVDLAAITEHVPFTRLVELAPDKDVGFDPKVLAHALGVTASQPSRTRVLTR